MRSCADILRRRSNAFELATLLTQEQGKPKREALNEVYAASQWFAAMAELEIPNESRTTDTGMAQIRHEPLGIVGAITSWNFPVFLAACKIASALLPGNVVLLKPSQYTPLATIRLVEMLTVSESQGPLPPGVATVVVGGSEVGNWFVESDDIAHVSFTGSIKVGRRILEKSAERFKSATLELGGNDAALVQADADVGKIAEQLFWGAFTNAGQFCTGIKRLYVQEAVYEEMVASLVQLARQTIVGDGLKPKTQMGPLTHGKQFDRIIDLVEDTRERGATVRAGGEPMSGRGFFYPPTIVIDVDEEHPIVIEEQFGPILPILPFTHVDDAVNRANSTNFGLGASVWTHDFELAEQIASELECGTVWVNQHGALNPLVPFGGYKQSGVGCENGWPGVSELTKVKVLHKSQPPANTNSST